MRVSMPDGSAGVIAMAMWYPLAPSAPNRNGNAPNRNGNAMNRNSNALSDWPRSCGPWESSPLIEIVPPWPSISGRAGLLDSLSLLPRPAPPVGLFQHRLSQPDRFWGHLDQLVLLDVFECQLQRQLPGRL